MGMDVYGLNPKLRSPEPTIDYEKTSEEEHRAFWNFKDKWMDDNPGFYFRSNIWWWRPLWDYVCTIGESFLTLKDRAEGHNNNGHKISATKAKRLAENLRNAIDSGHTLQWQSDRETWLKDLPEEPCYMCEGTGVRDEDTNDHVFNNLCKSCKGKGTMDNHETHYPFEIEHVKNFQRFCEESGGFEIC